MDFAEAKRIIAAFERHRIAYVGVGSMAMAAQGIVRATRGLDVFVASDPENVPRLRTALRELFDDPAVEAITPEDLAGAYPAIQYVPPAGAIPGVSPAESTGTAQSRKPIWPAHAGSARATATETTSPT